MTAVVVTGATGHLGRELVGALAGREVVAVSRGGLDVGHARGLACDLAEEAAVARLATVLGPRVSLVHLAACQPRATASTSADDRRELFAVNALGTMRVLDAVRAARGATRVVYASTFEVYGRGGLLDESSRTCPETDYGATKLSGEHHLAAFAHEEGIPVVSLRMPAIYGPGERASRALPNFLRRVARGERPVVHGDGGDLRDQLHVRDAAQAVVRALERGEGLYCVGDGEPHSIGDLARLAMKLAGMDGEPQRTRRAARRRDFHMSIDRARRELRFEPSVALEAGMREQLDWLRHHGAD